MDNKNIIGNEIVFDYYNEISIGELIYEIDNSKNIQLYKIDDNDNLEKNYELEEQQEHEIKKSNKKLTIFNFALILIQIKKGKK